MKVQYKILLLPALLLVIYACTAPSPPHSFVGTVKINGEYADTGLTVEAYINGTKSGECLTYAASEKTWYVLEMEHGKIGDIVSFKVDSNWTNENGTYGNPGEQTFLNLTVTTNASENIINKTITLPQGWNLISIPIDLSPS